MRTNAFVRTGSLLLVCLLAASGAAALGEKEMMETRGSGNVITTEFDVTGYDKIAFSGVKGFRVLQGDSYGVRITADDNIASAFRVISDGRTLSVIAPKGASATQMDVEVWAPAVSRLVVEQASRGSLGVFANASDLSVEVSGASTVELNDLRARDLTLVVITSSAVSGQVAATTLTYRVTGSSLSLSGSADTLVGTARDATVNLDGFALDDGRLQFSGESDGVTQLRGALSGRSQVNVTVEDESTLALDAQAIHAHTYVYNEATLRMLGDAHLHDESSTATVY